MSGIILSGNMFIANFMFGLYQLYQCLVNCCGLCIACLRILQLSKSIWTFL